MSRTALALAAVLLCGVLSGCGGGGSSTGSALDGRAEFLAAGCGTCHTYEPAGTAAEIGPDLAASTMTNAQLEERIRTGGGPMPGYEFELTPEQISAIAAFLLAGQQPPG